MQTHLTCHLQQQILKIYSTKQNFIWIIRGVTYRRTNTPNLSSKDGLSKEIENLEQEQQETRVWTMVVCFPVKESGVVGGWVSGGPGGALPTGWRAPLAGRASTWGAALGCPTGQPQALPCWILKNRTSDIIFVNFWKLRKMHISRC